VRLGDARFLADQNIDELVTGHLRSRGVDIVTTAELGPTRASDYEVLAQATASRRTLLTHDTGFGDLVFREGQPHSGVLLLRPGHAAPALVITLINASIDIEVDDAGRFFVSAALGPAGPVVRIRGTQ
jgi:predicted nuclease of predicted toxin-antitoxin system